MRLTHIRLPHALILLALTLLTACSTLFPEVTPPAPSLGETATEAAPPTPEREAAPTAAVTFRVAIPPDTPTEEPIQISLLDEVTGLAINPKRFTMQAESEGVFSVTLELPYEAVIKYRYTRQGEVLAEEHLADGRAVRYRLYKVDGPGEVRDVVSRWNDTPYEGPVGRITGKITDAQSGEPIPNILVAVGGAQTLTAWDGAFQLEGLPPGTHNLVAYAMDGSYRTFQQGAVVQENRETPAVFEMHPAPLVAVTFNVRVPADTIPAVPLRLAGNLYQFGNTFANLSGGVSVPAARMPVMEYQEDGRYTLTMQLPAGAFLRYKYTLGDGFWNAERTRSGGVPLREIVIPPGGVILNDEVETWASVDTAAIWFDVTVPAGTPPEEVVSLQFNPFGWMQPIPMWRLEENRWVYLLSSPLDVLDQFGYRYCRNDQCGSADDARTPGTDTDGQMLQTGQAFQSVEESIPAWQWPPTGGAFTPPEREVTPRGEDFLAGIEFQTNYHPNWLPYLSAGLQTLEEEGANWVVVRPTWTFSQIEPLVFETIPGADMPWLDAQAIISQAQTRGLKVALFPAPHFATQTALSGSPADLWWESAPRDPLWWDSWFEHYRAFALHHAQLAQQTGAQALILGGEWLHPALPDGFMADGFTSNVPPDALQRWRDMLAEVRATFDGTLAWALPYPQGVQNPPAFLDEVDAIYLLWSAPLNQQAGGSLETYRAEAEQLLDNVIFPFQNQYQKPLVLAIAYPSAQGGTSGCIPAPEGGCLPWEALARPNPDIPAVELDLTGQMEAYQALLEAIDSREWIAGVVARGYYPPVSLADKSTSVHGKPAEQVLGFWFRAWGGGE